MNGQNNFHGIKVSVDGDSLDSFSYGLEWADYLTEAVPTLDNGFLLAGYYWDPTAGHPQIEIMKISGAGDSLWCRFYDIDGSIDITNAAP